MSIGVDNRKKKVFLVGYLGYVSNQLDGQTVKTRNVYQVLEEKYHVKFYDTEQLKYNKISLFKLFLALFKYKKFFFIGGKNNLKYFFPLLFFISKMRKSEIVYVTVGGWLYDFLTSNASIYTYMLKNINSILVETNYLENNLAKLGLPNVLWIPNFRILSYQNTPKKIIKDNKKFNIVFMARIMEKKGIYLLFDFIKDYLENIYQYSKDISVTFYGPINPHEELKFKQLVDKYEPYIIYNGILDPTEIYETLPRYDVLVLPTYYEGEGFPGTILDAYLCGLPVITTKWKQIPEFVEEGKTGFLIDYDVTQLSERIQQLSNDNDLLSIMSDNAYNKSREYSSEIGLDILEKAMKL